jgi:3-oxoacyl-[acyl-carrier protein] reductase
MMARKKKEMPANPVAVVTGASRGIGKAVALALGEYGCKVVVNYSSNEAAANEVCEEIKAKGSEKGGSAIAIKANVGDPAEVSALFNKVIEEVSDNEVMNRRTSFVFIFRFHRHEFL